MGRACSACHVRRSSRWRMQVNLQIQTERCCLVSRFFFYFRRSFFCFRGKTVSIYFRNPDKILTRCSPHIACWLSWLFLGNLPWAHICAATWAKIMVRLLYVYIYVILYPLQHWLPADLLQIPQITQKFDCAPKCEGPWKIAHPLAFVLRGSIVWYFLLMHFCSAWWWPPVKPLKMRTGSEGFEGFDPGPDLLKGTGVGLAWAAWTARALCCFGHWRYGRPRVGQQNFV